MRSTNRTSSRMWHVWLSRFDSWTPANKIFSSMLAFALPSHLAHKAILGFIYGQEVKLGWPFNFGLIVISIIIIHSAILVWKRSSSRSPYYMIAYLYSFWAISLTVYYGAFDNAFSAFSLFMIVATFMMDGWAFARHVVLFWTVSAISVFGLQHLGYVEYGVGFDSEMNLARSESGWLLSNIIYMVLIIWSATGVMFLVTNSRARALEAVEQNQKLIRRYLPPTVADQIIEGREEEIRTPQRRRLTMLFADIVDFTEFADRVEPEIMTQVLSEYMSNMADIISDHGGTLNEFAGDGFMALFGAPSDLAPEQQASQSIAAAIAMQARMSALNKSWRQFGLQADLKMRIGINTGVASVGSYGSNERLTYTAIGLQTNIAARIEAAASAGEVLVSESTRQLLGDLYFFEPKGDILCKGIHFRIHIYRLKK